MKLDLRTTSMWLVIIAAFSFLVSRFLDVLLWPVFAVGMIFSCLNIVSSEWKGRFK
jgi:hypothetical protein